MSARLGALPIDAATGHTADDQAETVLLNLLRGAATDGLAAMRPGRRHPILALRRAETHDLCSRLGLQPVQDPTTEIRPTCATGSVMSWCLCSASSQAETSFLSSPDKRDFSLTTRPCWASSPHRSTRPTPKRSRRLLHPSPVGRYGSGCGVVIRLTWRLWTGSCRSRNGQRLAADVGSGRSVRRSRGRLRLEPAADAEPAGLLELEEPDILSCGPALPD